MNRTSETYHPRTYMQFFSRSDQHLSPPHTHTCTLRCCRLRRYRKVRGSWKAREDLSTIIVDADMFLDHTPHRFISLLKRLQRCPDLGVPERNRAGKPEIKITVV